MKTTRVLILRGSLILLIALVCFAFVHIRETKRAWPRRQLDGATVLGAGIGRYREVHGSYPERLAGLVTSGQMSAERYEKLMFRSSPLAARQEWLYQRPEAVGDIPIVAPEWLSPWRGHSGCRAIARTDGGGELVPLTKENQFPAWVDHR